eukprot:15172330-Ditylum_brightwellii.AAC.1
MITKNSTCGSTGLPPNICCIKYRSSVERANVKGVTPRKIKKWHWPFLDKNKQHREQARRDKYKNCIDFLNKHIILNDLQVDEEKQGSSVSHPLTAVIDGTVIRVTVSSICDVAEGLGRLGGGHRKIAGKNTTMKIW